MVHGSRALERAGRRVAMYDARGHGASTPAPPDAYDYARLAADAVAVLDHLGIDRAALVGQSMGSATAIAVALGHPGRVRALAVVTPAHLGAPSTKLDHGTRWPPASRAAAPRASSRRSGRSAWASAGATPFAP